jgi:DNA-binding transcriptional ArsR family regulator
MGRHRTNANRSRLRLTWISRAPRQQGRHCFGGHLSTVRRQAVAKHLKRLAEALLVVTIRSGREKLHHLNPMPIHEIAERWIGKYQRGRVRVLAELKKTLEGESNG